MKQKYIIYSMQRSGHHAIIFWLLNNFGGYNKNMETYIFWDDAKKLYYYNDCNHMPYNIVTDYKHLFMSYEDACNCTEHKKDDKIIIILRDFVNMLASRYKKFGNKLAFNGYYVQDIDKIVKVWKEQVYETINNKNVIAIYYNKWLFDNKYRDEICQKLSVENKNDRIDFVPSMGQGSSFCGMKLESNKDEYVKRFEKVTLPDSIKEKIKLDTELIELNKKIFDIDLMNIL